MKIKVHEIEGDYYCAIDDMAVVWARYMEQPTSGRNEAKYFFEWSDLHIFINSLDEYPHYIECYGDINAEHTPTRELLKENTLFYYDGNGDYRLLKNGMYHVAKARFELIGNPGRVRKIFVTHVKISNGISDHDAPFFLYRTIKDMDGYELPVIPADCPELYDSDKYYNPYDNNFVIEKATAKEFYATLADAAMYLSQTDEKIDFIMPNTPQAELIEQAKEQPETESTTPKAEPVAELAPEIETPPYLDRDNPSHAPLLAVAIDVWERLFIHKEGNPKIGLEPRAIELIEKHYPHLTSQKEKNNTAYVAITHRGNKEKSQKSENNG